MSVLKTTVHLTWLMLMGAVVSCSDASVDVQPYLIMRSLEWLIHDKRGQSASWSVALLVHQREKGTDKPLRFEE